MAEGRNGVRAALFPSTRWTAILAARRDPALRRAALEELLAPRWQPLYVLARKHGLDPSAADDAVQSSPYGDIPWLGDELVVVGDEREVWVGPAAFIGCLWALEEWREWSYRLSGTAFVPLAERFFLMVSARRRSFARLLGPECEGGTCRRRHATAAR